MADLRRLVNPPLAALGEPEMLDRVGDVDIFLGHPSLGQRVLKQPSCWTDEGNALAIFDVTWTFPNQSQGCSRIPGGEDNLCCGLPQLAALTVMRGTPKIFHIGVLRHPRCRSLSQDRLLVIRQSSLPRCLARDHVAVLRA